MLREDEIDAQLQRILESSVFATSARSKQFLEFCVNRARYGHISQLKETTIALEVFMRPVDYDPKSDPIVRVHARRVREKLHLYYRTVGAADPIKIDLPKGGYVPVIHSVMGLQPPTQKSQIAQIEPVAPVLPSLLPFPSPQTAEKHPFAKRSLWGISLALFLMAAIWMLRGGSTSAKANYLNALQPISALPDGVCDASWSPEGDRLIFAAPSEGSSNLHIFMRRVHSVDQPQQITIGDHSESRPVWSSDGREIAFVRQADLSHFDIIRLNLSTHRETAVGRFVSYWPMAMDHPALDWSRDGRYFLTAEQTAPETPMRLIVVSAADGSRRILTSPRSNSSGDVEGKFSPDGQHVAFRRGGQGDLFLVSMRGELSEPVRQLTHDTKGVRGIAWENDDQTILFGSQRGRTAALGIWRVSIDGGEPIPITEPGFDATNPAVSNKGAMLIEHREIVSELAEQTMDSQDKPVTILPSNALDSAPAYSPDGRSIAFISTRSGWPELWLHQDNGTLLQITHLAGTGTIFMPAWAPDGHAIVFSVRNNGATNIYVDDLRLNSVRKLTSTRNRDISPVYSSDSKSIFFSSNDDGTSRIWRVHEDGTERPEPLFVEATLGFQTSMDGNWLYYWQSGQTFTLARRNLIDGSTEPIFTIPGRPAFLDCRYIAGNKVYVASSKGNLSEADVYEVNPETKEARLAAQLHEIAPPAMYVMAGMSIRPDGKRLIYSRKKYDKTMLLSANK